MTKPVKPTLDGTPLRPEHPLYDAAARRELDRRKERIAARRAKSDEELWREGQEFLTIRDNKLFRQDGYSSMSVWVAKCLGRGRRSVAERMRFAEHFSLNHVVAHGRDKLELLLDYTALTHADEEEWKVEGLRLVVPAANGRVVEVPALRASMDQIEAALKHQHELAQERGRRLPAPQEDFVSDLSTAVEVDGRPLALIAGRSSDTGLLDDLRLRLDVRAGDLESVAHRILEALAKQKEQRRGRGRSR